MANRHQRRADAASGAPQSSAPGQPLPGNTEVTLRPVPSFYASALQIAQAGNDFNLQFSRFAMGTTVIDNVVTPVAQVTPVAEVVLSPQTMKDWVLSAQAAVDQYEAEFGAIETAYTRKLASEAEA